jgi:papain like protease
MSSGDFNNDQGSSSWSAQASGAGDGFGEESGGWTQDDFSVEASEDFSRFDSEKHVQVFGANLGKHSIKDDVRTGAEVQAFDVNEERDAEVGIELSKYNLNFVFNKTDQFKCASLEERLGAPVDPKTLPAKVDLRADLGGVIYDQGVIGSCVSNTTAYGIRQVYKKRTGKVFLPSRLYIYFNGRLLAKLPANVDTGLTISEGYASVDRYSAPDEALWKYDVSQWKNKPSAQAYSAALKMPDFEFVRIPSDLNQLKKCLADGFFISFGAALFSSFMTAQVARTGVVPNPDVNKEKRVGGHAMTLVGFDDARKVFIVANSWSTRWGDKGCCTIGFDYILNRNLVSDFCSPRTFK